MQGRQQLLPLQPRQLRLVLPLLPLLTPALLLQAAAAAVLVVALQQQLPLLLLPRPLR